LADSSTTTWLPHVVSGDPLTGALAPALVGPVVAVGPLAVSTVGAPAAQAAVEVARARLMSTRATRVMRSDYGRSRWVPVGVMPAEDVPNARSTTSTGSEWFSRRVSGVLPPWRLVWIYYA
jgi:hypothetical protein